MAHDDTGPRPPTGLDAARALGVVRNLEDELGGAVTDTHAIVGLRDDLDSVALVDVSLADSGVLTPSADTHGLLVVTSEASGPGEATRHRHLFCVLPDGVEVGVVQSDGDGTRREWHGDADAGSELPRPAGTAANAARRAFGLPSVVREVPDPASCLARAWLSSISRAALERFDGHGGPRVVTASELEDAAARTATQVDDRPGWPELHRAAAGGGLGELGVDPSHAAWLDTPGFAQVVDERLPSVEQLMAALRVTAGDDGAELAIGLIATRGWYDPDE